MCRVRCAVYIHIYIAAWWLCIEYLFYYIAGCLLHGYRKRLRCGGGSSVKGMILQLFPPPDSFPFTHFFLLYITSLSLSLSLPLSPLSPHPLLACMHACLILH